jgi:hypothetical protein
VRGEAELGVVIEAPGPPGVATGHADGSEQCRDAAEDEEPNEAERVATFEASNANDYYQPREEENQRQTVHQGNENHGLGIGAVAANLTARAAFQHIRARELFCGRDDRPQRPGRRPT